MTNIDGRVVGLRKRRVGHGGRRRGKRRRLLALLGVDESRAYYLLKKLADAGPGWNPTPCEAK